MHRPGALPSSHPSAALLGPSAPALLLIRVRGQELMSSRVHGSEEEMARLASAALGGVPNPRVLIGGLGLGYTLRATLEALGPGAQTHSARAGKGRGTRHTLFVAQRRK